MPKKVNLASIENLYENINNKFSINKVNETKKPTNEFDTILYSSSNNGRYYDSYSNNNNFSSGGFSIKKLKMANIENIYENINNKFSIGKGNSQKKSVNEYDNVFYTSTPKPKDYGESSGFNIKKINMTNIENLYENINNKFSIKKKVIQIVKIMITIIMIPLTTIRIIMVVVVVVEAITPVEVSMIKLPPPPKKLLIICKIIIILLTLIVVLTTPMPPPRITSKI